MRRLAGWSSLLAYLIATLGVATAAEEHIGSWVIICPDGTPCLMRFSKRFLNKAGVTGDLEIMAQGNRLVPVIALRGLPAEVLMAASMAGRAEASLQLASGAREALQCAPSEAGYICAPSEAAGATLAAALPDAQRITVRVAVAVAGMDPLPAQQRSLDLFGTAEALDRLRAVGPTPVPGLITALTAQSPAGLIGMADKALKAAGYRNGVADLQALIAKYMSK